MNRLILLLLALLLGSWENGRAQNHHTDVLGSSLFSARRDQFVAKMPPQTAAVVFSGGLQAISPRQEVPVDFEPDPAFYYLTGVRMPNAVLVLFAEPQVLAEGEFSAVLFLSEDRDQFLEWAGYGMDKPYGVQPSGLLLRPNGEWRKFVAEVLDGKGFPSVYAQTYKGSGWQHGRSEAYEDLAQTFFARMAPRFPFQPEAQQFYEAISKLKWEDREALAIRINSYRSYFSWFGKDPFLERFLRLETEAELEKLQEDLSRIRVQLGFVDATALALWRKPDSEEIRIHRDIADRLVAAFSYLPQGKNLAAMREADLLRRLELEALEGTDLRTGNANRVAAGSNSSRLTYSHLHDPIPASGPVVVDLTLRDVCYRTRIGRTLPASGRFSAEEEAVMKELAEAHRRAIAACKAGGAPSQLKMAADPVLARVREKSGITSDKAWRQTLLLTGVTGIGMMLDEGIPPVPFEAGTILTVETFISFGNHKEMPAALAGKGFLLLDTVLVTESGPEVLTGKVPLIPSE